MRRGAWIALGLMVAASLVAESLAEWRYWWEQIPGFYALFGFFGFMAIVFFSKWLGRLFVQKQEGYYDRG